MNVVEIFKAAALSEPQLFQLYVLMFSGELNDDMRMFVGSLFVSV